jgi:hypothetical protein
MQSRWHHEIRSGPSDFYNCYKMTSYQDLPGHVRSTDCFGIGSYDPITPKTRCYQFLVFCDVNPDMTLESVRNTLNAECLSWKFQKEANLANEKYTCRVSLPSPCTPEEVVTMFTVAGFRFDPAHLPCPIDKVVHFASGMCISSMPRSRVVTTLDTHGLYPYQKDILEMCQTPDDNTVDVISASECGVSALMEWLEHYGHAHEIPAKADILETVMAHPHAAAYITRPRTALMPDLLLVKKGLIHAGGKTIRMERPRVIVFVPTLPDVGPEHKVRKVWKVWKVVDNELVPQ